MDNLRMPLNPTSKMMYAARNAAGLLPPAQRLDIDAVMNAVYQAFLANAPRIPDTVPDTIAPPSVFGRVDAWELQREVMALSNQNLPTVVCITPQVVMYHALQVEEVGETAAALADAIVNGYLPQGSYAPVASVDADKKAPDQSTAWHDANAYMRCCDDLRETATWCKKQSASLRNLIKVSFGQRQPGLAIRLEHAKELADGFCDTIVVSAGAAISAGMPGAELYYETTMSNVTKANPETGVIDKETDGKWIKGPNYRAPQLAALLAPLLWDGGCPGWEKRAETWTNVPEQDLI